MTARGKFIGSATDIAVFSGGWKIYNSDFSASYYIGARCWIKEYSKSPCRNAGRCRQRKALPVLRISLRIGFAH
ncbi:MAG TPA: hypothetical protein DCP92_19760 [Nitrospiraceae bacterium]|nr:hypothetical protein [Nitrospiraceae bacterium]